MDTENEKNILDELPTIVLGDCIKCGAKNTEWTACNTNNNNEVTDCNKCQERIQ